MICPKCGYDWSDNSEMNYCKNCGMSLHNYCSNADCICNSNYDLPVEFNSNDCYCDECGSKTTFYEAGVIEPDLK